MTVRASYFYQFKEVYSPTGSDLTGIFHPTPTFSECCRNSTILSDIFADIVNFYNSLSTKILKTKRS